MNRTQETDFAIKLIHQLTAAYCMRPDQITISPTVLSVSTSFAIRAHAADMGRLVGKEGVNIKALNRIFRRIGQLWGTSFFISLRNDPVGEKADIPAKPRRDETQSFNFQPANNLLTTIVGEMAEFPYVIEAMPIEGAVHFSVGLDRADYAAFLSEGGPRDHQTLKDALEVLWSAYGSKEGVSFQIDVVALRGKEKTT